MIQYNERLKNMREDRDWTQEQVAKMLQTTKQQISKYENSKQDMTVQVFRKLCKIYNVSANYILDLPKNGYDPR